MAATLRIDAASPATLPACMAQGQHLLDLGRQVLQRPQGPVGAVQGPLRDGPKILPEAPEQECLLPKEEQDPLLSWR